MIDEKPVRLPLLNNGKHIPKTEITAKQYKNIKFKPVRKWKNNTDNKITEKSKKIKKYFLYKAENKTSNEKTLNRTVNQAIRKPAIINTVPLILIPKR